MFNRFTEVVKYPASLNRWVALGNLAHQFLYSNFKWDISNVNGKVLIIHEPNLQFAEGDAFPHDSEYIIDELIKYFKIKSIDIDLKVHPNWRSGIGNAGEVLKKFNCNYVDIEVEEIVNYSLVIGSRSSVLYDSYLMGVPVFSIESTSDWKDDEIFFTKLGIIKSYNLENLNTAFIDNYNIPYSIDYQLVKSISGDIVNVKLSEEIYNFLKLKHFINHTFGGKVKSYFLPQFRFFYEKFKILYLRLLIK
jgi:ribosome-binding factor A